METEIFNLLVAGGPLGTVAAFFFYRWQKVEAELKEERAASRIRDDANYQAMLGLQEKRIVDVGRLEGIVVSNNSTIASQSQLLQALVNQRSSS